MSGQINHNFQQPKQKQEQVSADNPLKQYFRTFQLWTSLPSKNMGVYPEQIAEMNDDAEIGVQPMTGQDEIILKNPDALLNGEAMKHILKSCCPAIKDPDHLMINDVEALMVAIRIASYGKEMEMEVKCPKCKANNTVALNLEEVLQTMDYLDEDHSVVIQNHDGSVLRVHFVPFMYKSHLKIAKQSFEEEKILKGLERMSQQGKDVDESIQIKQMSDSYSRIANMGYEMITECVNKITSEDEGNDMEVTEPKHIREFMYNISRESSDKISKELNRISDIGIRKEYDVTCEKCEHEWQEKMSFDASTFF